MQPDELIILARRLVQRLVNLRRGYFSGQQEAQEASDRLRNVTFVTGPAPRGSFVHAQ